MQPSLFGGKDRGVPEAFFTDAIGVMSMPGKF
jgi:hypothetical protein